MNNNSMKVSDFLAQVAGGKHPYVAPDIEIYPVEQTYSLLVGSEIKPKPGGPEVHDPDKDDDEEIEFE